MRKKHSIKLLLLLLVVATATLSHNGFMSQLINSELDNVDARTSTIIVAGKTYKYKLDVENSSYLFPADAKTSLSLSQLRAGEKYYFEIVSRGKDMQDNKFNEVIFISNQKPSE